MIEKARILLSKIAEKRHDGVLVAKDGDTHEDEDENFEGIRSTKTKTNPKQ